MATANLTSNQYYGGLNRRFDKRVRRLHQLGFRQESISDMGISVFRRRQNHSVIAGSFVMHADNRAFNDRLASFRFGI